jgi:hypothetical protein
MTGAMPTTTADQPDLWSLVKGAPWIDPSALLAAIERQLRDPLRDYRTRLLLRDALDALEKRWGADRLRSSLSAELRDEALRIRSAVDLGTESGGFPSLESRMAEPTESRTILQFLRELGDRLQSPARLDVGGSSALILAGLLSRATDDIDAVNEVPASIRVQHDLLDELAKRYGLSLAHFQSHYLPAGWENRLRSLGRFGKLDVFLVDPLDIFVGKLFSKRTKDLDDLRMLQDSFEQGAIAERLRSGGAVLLADPLLRPDAERNWNILYGQPLPA